MTDEQRAGIKKTVAALVQREYEGDVIAVAFCIVRKDGNMYSNYCIPEGTKMGLYTAASLLQRDILSEFKTYERGEE